MRRVTLDGVEARLRDRAVVGVLRIIVPIGRMRYGGL